MRYVIIGNSAAAIGAVEGIRTVDKDGDIAIVSNESHHTYSRPLISYLLCGQTTKEKMKYRPDSFYEDNGCTVFFGTECEKIDEKEQTVTLSDSRKLSYDRLLIATGSSPAVPPIDGLSTVQNKFTFMYLSDAEALEQALKPKSRVLILGAGLIGLKCAEGIAGLAGKITVVDLADRILPNVLDEDAAAIVQRQMENHGINFVLADGASRFEDKKAFLKSGREIEFDVLVVAVGVRPNTSLICNLGADAKRGIVTNNRQQTEFTNIFAAGDCTVSRDLTTGQNKILALLPNAYMQGHCAGVNMALGQAVYDNAIPINAAGFFGLHLVTAGSYDGIAYVEKTENTYKKLVVKDGLLKGFIIIGDVTRSGIYTSLIRNQTPLDTIDFDLIRRSPGLMAFSRQKRDVILGGAKS